MDPVLLKLNMRKFVSDDMYDEKEMNGMNQTFSYFDVFPTRE